jgi:hypothetical protein
LRFHAESWLNGTLSHHSGSTVQYSTVQYSTVQYSTVQYDKLLTYFLMREPPAPPQPVKWKDLGLPFKTGSSLFVRACTVVELAPINSENGTCTSTVDNHVILT